MSKPVLQYVALCILAAWAVVAQSAYSALLIFEQVNSDRYMRVPFFTRSYTSTIEAIFPTYEDSGLRVGDRVLALNRRRVNGLEQIDRARFFQGPGDLLQVTVQRSLPDGRISVLTIPVRLHEYRSEGLAWLTLTARTLLPLCCLLVGFFIAFVRPRDPLAWITMAMLTSFAEGVSGFEYWSIWPPWRELFIIYHSVLTNMWPLWVVLFGLYFPMPFEVIRRNRWIAWVLAAPFICVAAISLYADLAEGNHYAELTQIAAANQLTQRPLDIVSGLCAVSFFILLAAKRRRLDSPDAKRRINIMLAGCFVSVVPLVLFVLFSVNMIPAPSNWLDAGLVLPLTLLFPVTMAYVIIVQRAMDVRMVVRMGVKYAFASTTLNVLRLALIVLAIMFTVRFITDSEHHWQALLFGLIGTAVVIGLRRSSNTATRWMDRKFFREAYNAEIILSGLANTVARIRDRKPLLETIALRISDSLHPVCMAILLDSGERYSVAHSIGLPSPDNLQFPKRCATLRLLKEQNAPAKVFFDDPQSWVYGATEAEQETLRNLNAQILIPISLDSRLLGIMTLGPKRSEAPYSRRDLQLLSAVASQAGLALDNARLTENIRREIAQRERLDRELEIAREVQQRLFPQKLPHVQGLDFAGYCRPALGVGGDYYDFIRLDSGCLGVAIGDVSGKGIAAALMMASLQASLRGQTIAPCETLAEMIQHVNRLVFESSSDNRYATFFYAEYDPKTRSIRYVNAGHNAPILSRNHSQKYVLRLEDGGTVLGLFPDAPYREAKVDTRPGDMVVAFTDGISEAMNAREEEFGEERLIDTVRRCNSRTAAELITCILDQVDAFTAGAPQHDDMTLVVMRMSD
ncbi:MAG: SpoIIE family protein phosphatase [Acidobacteriaceae bacterium]|nr:SpoIIE family protein phosphatase [Acidobacteriaceae bacterium]